jgi:hypothetical protein
VPEGFLGGSSVWRRPIVAGSTGPKNLITISQSRKKDKSKHIVASVGRHHGADTIG